MKDPEDNGYKLGIDLHVKVKGASQSEAEELIQKLHQVCPYSKATRGNVDVQLDVRGE